MKLAEYLTEAKMTAEAFAVSMSVAPSSVSRWLSGEKFPRPERLAQIAKITDGKVTANDFIPLPAPIIALPPSEDRRTREKAGLDPRVADAASDAEAA